MHETNINGLPFVNDVIGGKNEIRTSLFLPVVKFLYKTKNGMNDVLALNILLLVVKEIRRNHY